MQPFVLAPLDSGLNTYYPAWIAPENAFYRLIDAYPRRGRLTKRIGDGPLVDPATQDEARAPQYTTGGTYTIDVATGVITLDPGPSALVLGQRIWLDQSGNGYGPFTVTATTSTTVTVYPLPSAYSRPGAVMVDGLVECFLSIQGMVVYETSRGANQGELIAMTGRQLLRLDPSNNQLASVTFVESEAPFALNYDTLGGTNFDGELFVTNFRDSVYRLSVPAAPQARWYAPRVEGTNFIQSCRKLVTYRGRLLMMNTYEGSQQITVVGDLTTATINLTVNGIAHPITPAGATATLRFEDVVAKLKALPEISNAIGTYEGGGNSPIHICPAHAALSGTNYVSAMTGGGTTFVLGALQLTNYPYRVRFSVGGLALDDSTSFRNDLLNGSGFDDALTGEAIVSAEVQNDLCLVFFERSLWQLQFGGNPLDPFQWVRINNQYGSGSESATWNYDDALVSMSQQGIVRTDGRSIERIDLPLLDLTLQIESSVQSGANDRQGSNFRRVHVLQDYNKQLLVWAYPSEQTSSTANDRSIVRNDRVLYWNYLQNAWGEGRAFWTCLASYRTVNEVTWEDLTLPWEAYTSPWESFGGQDEKFLMVAGHDSGRILEISDIIPTTTDRWGVPQPFGVQILSKFHSPFIEQGQAVRVSYVDIYGGVTSQGVLTLNVYADDNLNVPVSNSVLRFSEQTGTLDTVFRVYCNAYGRNLAFEVVLNESQVQVPANSEAKTQVQGMIIYAQAAGRFFQATL